MFDIINVKIIIGDSMNYNVIATFEHNNKTYLFYTYDDIEQKDINVLYGYYDSSKNIKPINDNDISLMNKISSDIFISKDKSNHVKLNSIIYNGKVFQVMYDKISGLKFFYELKDGIYSIPCDDDLIYLANTYNKVTYNLKLFEMVDENEKANMPFLKKYSWVGGTLFLCTIAITTILAMPKIHTKYQIVTQKIEYNNDEYLKDNFSIDRVIAAIKENTNLTDEEKEFFVNQNDILIKYFKYIDITDLEEKLRNFSIDYIEENHSTLLGTWKKEDLKMVIYNATSFSNADKEIMCHEYNHVCSKVYMPFGDGLNEAISEVISNERMGNKRDIARKSYPGLCAYLKILCEIIGPQPFMAYYYSGNIYNIIDALKEVIPDEDMAIKLIGEIDNVHINETEYGKLYTEDMENGESTYSSLKKEDIKNNVINSDKEIYDLLYKYFYMKHEYLMENDALAMIYLSSFNNNLSIPKIYIENKTGYISENGEIGFYNYVDMTSLNKKYFIDEDEEAIINASTLTFMDIFESEFSSDSVNHYDVYKYTIDDKEISFVSSTKSYILDSETRIMKNGPDGQKIISAKKNMDEKVKG